VSIGTNLAPLEPDPHLMCCLMAYLLGRQTGQERDEDRYEDQVHHERTKDQAVLIWTTYTVFIVFAHSTFVPTWISCLWRSIRIRPTWRRLSGWCE
jgi:hypothetical protein